MPQRQLIHNGLHQERSFHQSPLITRQGFGSGGRPTSPTPSKEGNRSHRLMASEKLAPEGKYIPLWNSEDEISGEVSKEVQGQQSARSRLLNCVNILVVGIIIYFIGISISNFCQHCPRISEDEAEYIILNSPSPGYIRKQSQLYTSGPHLAGKNITQATFTRDLWESYGIKSKIEEYEVLLNYPISHRLALLHDEEVQYEAELREDVIPEDPSSADPDVVPTFHGYSANGNVTGELVYANFGHVDDFRLLEKNGVNVSGKVVIVRYGSTFRGLKVKAAQEFGAIGVIIYSDPHEDGKLQEEKPYPQGPGRHPSSVQRGSVQFLSKLPGDPSTPGYASKPGVNRSDTKEYIPSIPSLPISYRDALPFLKSLNRGNLCGSKLGENWPGSLHGVEYCVENPKSNLTVNLVNEVEFVYTPIYNVIGHIPGTLPQEIILGNHRDAWVYGAGDPSSGSAAFNAVIQSFSRLLKTGWKPLRTIVFASWDAEEYGLVGSTEWVEDHAKHLTKYALAYLNVDIGAAGDALNIAASPLLDDVLVQASKDIVTNTGMTMYENWVNTSGKAEVGVLGSGSDFTGFLQLLGIASSDMGFANRKAIYHYHSNYDDFYWMDTFGDPGWFHHQQIAQLWGLTALRLATSKIVSFNATNYTNKIKSYLNTLESLFHNTVSPADFESLKKHLKLDQLEDAIHDLTKYAHHLDSKANDLIRHPVHRKCYLFGVLCISRTRVGEIDRVNKAYLEFERGFVGKGLPGRPVYKHVIYAPGTWEGYAGLTFPSIREAIAEARWDEAKEQVMEISKLLKRGAAGKGIQKSGHCA